MPRRTKHEKKNRTGGIPTDSFSDIAFLLIIYFLVATTLMKVKTITADLPSGEKSAQTESEKTPIVNLNGTEIIFNDDNMTMEELQERLAALELGTKEPDDRVIMLESTKGTPYQNYFQALAAISANDGIVAIVEEDE